MNRLFSCAFSWLSHNDVISIFSLLNYLLIDSWHLYQMSFTYNHASLNWRQLEIHWLSQVNQVICIKHRQKSVWYRWFFNVTYTSAVIPQLCLYSSVTLSIVLPHECHTTGTGHDTPPCNSIQTQDMTPNPVTVYRHRTWHSTLSQYTDTGHDTHPVTVNRHRTWHPTLSQYTDTGHDTPPHSQYSDTGHDTPPHSQYTGTGHDTPSCHSLQTYDMTPHPVTVYKDMTWHPILSQYIDTGHDTPSCHSLQTQDMIHQPITVYRHRARVNLLLCYPSFKHHNYPFLTWPRNPSSTFNTQNELSNPILMRHYWVRSLVENVLSAWNL